MKSSTDKMIEYFENKPLTSEQRQEADFLIGRKTYSAKQTLRFVELVLEIAQNPSARHLSEVS